ncbi:hypothetical protein AGMMS4956_10830 [Bacteroidia bacterium]|nr:hypothetical protein AGMMS4956_10830 [Bacteroidia bacterium]
MKRKLFISLVPFLICFSCEQTNQDAVNSVDSLNQEAFELRANKECAIQKTEKVFDLISKSCPTYKRGEAVAWNNLGMVYFLSNEYDTAKKYIEQVKGISENYPNKELEEDIANITLASIYRYERRRDKEMQVLCEQLRLFKVPKDDLHSTFNTNELDTFSQQRYYYAQSEFYLELLAVKEDKFTNLKKSYDNQIFSPAYLDTFQMNEAYYRKAYNYYKLSCSTKLPEQSDYMNKCFSELKLWLSWLSITKSPKHVANFYEFYSRLINDKNCAFLVEKFCDDENYICIKKVLIENVGCKKNISLDSLSLLLLEKASSMTGISKFDKAWYNLQLGNYFYARNNVAKTDEWYKKYSSLELDNVNKTGNSLRISKNRNVGYQGFLKKYVKFYSQLQEVFQKEADDEFHDDEVFLNQTIRLQSLLQYEETARKNAERNTSALMVFICILLIGIICLSFFYIKKRRFILSLMKATPDGIMLLIQAEREKREKKIFFSYFKKIFKVLLFLGIVAFLLYFIFFCWNILRHHNEVLSFISIIITIIGIVQTVLFRVRLRL